ncbi:hypothetical protein Mal4_16960 [Maioricimonas rarisocia]|uniref:DUF4185 domain-containing protein n=1 Tax=Maioricimonas rarisocia TaxID=2528026 RepID=A0A517Z4M0_9PLAN|nr:DUF4185 domain-containing protein [Maioricimonas rarisocia]QDU37385.1 hypothetical protein Mal4_16960 [Maioricimonas rarisocia]
MLSILELTLALALTAAPQPEYFTIRVVDADTGRGVPLVELTTVNNIRLVTDSNGIAAFHEPGLMNRQIWFNIRSHGYEFPADGLGYRGRRLTTVPGDDATLEINRLNIAERLYRVTGAGIYRDSILVGRETPLRQPLLNAQVFGSDSVVNAVYRGKIYWFWGDTNRPSYPLGNFHVPGATSLLPADGGLDPERGINLDYFTDEDGFASETCHMPGDGPTWIDGLTVVRDEAGDERMFARYGKVRPPLTIYERGLVQFDDDQQKFEKVQTFPDDAFLMPDWHPVHHEMEGTDYVLYGRQIPLVRVRATAEAVQDLSQYEAYTCFTQGSRPDSYTLDRDQAGALRFAWRKNTLAPTPDLEKELLEQGKLSEEETLFRLTDVETGKPVRIHSSSVARNDYRQKWVMIALELFGSSLLGEIWYAEADAPTGPWKTARKVVTHDNYSFYNPKQHPMLAKDGGRIIYFEGTYTHTFSGNPDQTPRYDYNQIMYRLDLADPRLRITP